jgi:1,4-dihydroxy-2-naphthoate octaprenyltransferase
LATNILVTNNYRDVETDARAGKRTTVVRFGRGFARAQFLAGHAVALLAVAGLAARGVVAWELAGAILVWGLWEARRQFRVLRRATTAAELIALLGRTGRQVAVYAGLLAAAMVWLPG